MQRYEFKVVPAPRRAEKLRGLKTTEDRFANTLTLIMNTYGMDGWDYVRSDTLPCDERVGLTGSRTSFQNVLVFRRVLASIDEPGQPPVMPRLGAADAVAGQAPALGPANSGMAAE